MCVSVHIAYIGYMSCGILPWIPFHSVVSGIGDNRHHVSILLVRYNAGLLYFCTVRFAVVYLKLFAQWIEIISLSNVFWVKFSGLIQTLHIDLVIMCFCLAPIAWEDRTRSMACWGHGSLFVRSMAAGLRRCFLTALAPHSVRECFCWLSGICLQYSGP